MKVLHQGVVPDRRIRAACMTCKTRIEFLPEEGRDASDPTDQRSVGLVAIRCPTCGSEVVGKERR
jgi:DNA-directed RNA polymerase subunit RPC12/RpoP